MGRTLTPQFKGGIVARDFLLQHGAKEDQADSVCESIILHQDVWVKGGNISLNGQMIILGTWVASRSITNTADADPDPS